MRASAGAAIGVVAKGVNMHAALGIGVVAGDVVGDGGLCVFRGLLKRHRALDIGVSTENSDCEETLAMCSPRDASDTVDGSRSSPSTRAKPHGVSGLSASQPSRCRDSQPIPRAMVSGTDRRTAGLVHPLAG